MGMRKLLVAVLAVVAAAMVFLLIFSGVMLFGEKKTPSLAPASSATAEEASSEGNTVTKAYAIPVPQSAKLHEDETTLAIAEPGATVPGETAAAGATDAAGTTAAQANATTAAAKTYTKKQAIAAVATGVAYCKAAKNFTAVRRRVTKITLDECSATVLAGAVQSVIDKYTGDSSQTYRFAGGQALDSETNETVSPNDVIPPGGRTFTLEDAGVTGYSVEASGENMVFTLHIVAETCTLASPVPPYHAQAMNYLDLTELENGTAKLTEANFTYEASTIILTLDPAGIPIALREIVPMNGSGGGSMLGFSATGAISGSMDESWTFTW